jgi:hypothetical protein
VVHIVVAGYIVDHYCLRFDKEVVCIVAAGYIVDHYCLRFDREVVPIVVASYTVEFLLFWQNEDTIDRVKKCCLAMGHF